MSYSGMGTVPATPVAPRTLPNMSPPSAQPCPPGFNLTPSAPGFPSRCVQAYAPPPSIAPSAPVSGWRSQLQRMLEGASVLILSLPGEVMAQLVALFAGLGPAARQEGEAFDRALRDPSQSDADVAAKLKAVSDRYRSLRPNLPAPAVRIFDPVVDNAWNLVPPELRSAGNQNVSTACSSDVPWMWIVGGFLGGLATAAVFGSNKPTPNRRVRRNRRRR